MRRTNEIAEVYVLSGRLRGPNSPVEVSHVQETPTKLDVQVRRCLGEGDGRRPDVGIGKRVLPESIRQLYRPN